MNDLIWAFTPTPWRWVYIICTVAQMWGYAASRVAFWVMVEDGKAEYQLKEAHHPTS